MKTMRLFTALLLLATANLAGEIPETMSYQGVLTDASGNPVPDGGYDITFTMYDALTEGTALWTETQSVPVADGMFHVILGSGTPLDLAFDSPYWLGIKIGGDPELTPRIELTSSAYSLNARGVLGDTNVFPSNDKVGIGTTEPSEMLEVAGTIHSTTGGFKFPDGTIQTTAAAGTGADAWSLTGNAGTSPGTNFLGTTDEQPLEFHVNSQRAFRIEPHAVAPNIIGGYSGNIVSGGVEGATIAGGGSLTDGMRNRVTGNYGSIGGGLFNIAAENAVAGGGKWNFADGFTSTISGGYYNVATQNYATIGGGMDNEANGVMATVAGGAGNEARYRGFVGGGEHNAATGNFATVPGGNENKARGAYSFSAGYKAKANHNGSFVWSDFSSVSDSTNSTDENQFIIRAAGGVGIGTNSPDEMLTVAGTIKSTTGGFKFPDGTLQTTAATGGLGDNHSLDAADGNPVDALYVDNDGQVGIGTTNPQRHLHLAQPDHVTLVLEDTGAPADQKKKFINADNGNLRFGKFSDSWDFTPLFFMNDEGKVNFGGTNTSDPTSSDYLFTIYNVSNALHVKSYTGRAAYFESVDTDESATTVRIRNGTQGAGLYVTVENGYGDSGTCGYFGTTDTYTTSSTLVCETNARGNAFVANHTGPMGDIAVFKNNSSNVARIDKTGKGYFNGGTQTGGADVAEALDVWGSPADYEPGDVMIISPRGDFRVEKSRTPYATSVIGVIATKPGVLLTEKLVEDGPSGTLPVGVVGVIPTKVSGENGPIERGDLLVTSSTPGYAMKGTERDKMLGAVIGKAFEPFHESGTGRIKVIVNVK